MSPPLAGIHHVKFPVSDLAASRSWYEAVFGLTLQMEFRDEDDGPGRGIVFEPVDGVYIALRHNPQAAAGLAGFDPVSLGVADRAALDRWIAHLDDLGIDHSPPIDASIGWIVVFRDPDGIEHHLYTMAAHGIDHTGEAGYGQTG